MDAGTNEYKVLQGFELEGKEYAEGDTVSLTEEAAAPLLEESKIEATAGGSEDDE